MVLLWKGLLKIKISLFLSQNRPEQLKKTVDSRDIYDSQKDYDPLKRQWTIIEREIEIERLSFQEQRLLRIVN